MQESKDGTTINLEMTLASHDLEPMGGNGDYPSSAFARLSRSIRERLTDYLDLAPAETTRETRVLSQSVDALKDRLGAVLAERRRLQNEREALAAAPSDQAARAEQAIGLGRDDLARAALRQRALIDARADDLERDLDALAAEAERLQSLLGDGAGGDPSLANKLAELDRLLSAEAKER